MAAVLFWIVKFCSFCTVLKNNINMIGGNWLVMNAAGFAELAKYIPIF